MNTPSSSTLSSSTLSLPLPELASQFLLKEDVVFLNHGSFGACPRPVFEVYQHWQRELEGDPVDFLGRRAPDLMLESRKELAAYLNAPVEQLVFVPNATYGINVVSRSLQLEPGDEILTTNQEYGAVNNTWRFNFDKRGVRYINYPMPLPLTTPEEFVDRLWQGVTPRTKVITFSHITSPTALIFPAKLICQRARAEGILTVIDGAHAPGQIDIDLAAMEVDYYTGNCHKWLCSPKGSAFLYAAPGRENELEPLVVSHGWSRPHDEQSKFLDNFNWTGTMDPSAYISVGAAVRFQRENNWPAVRAACHALASQTRDRINEITGLAPVSPDSTTWFSQMFVARLPAATREKLHDVLWPEFKIEVPLPLWNDEPLIRISVQAYNTPEDMERLLGAIEKYL
jgi:isopenicillin-N epimerase